jgi:hypothetical protein
MESLWSKEDSSSSSSCENFSDIAEDQQRKCWTPKVKAKSKWPKKEFRVTFESKEQSPWADYIQGDTSIAINGKVGAVIHLNRGRKYYFSVSQNWTEGTMPAHLFALTTSPAGGSNSRLIPGSFQPVAKGTVCFEVTNKTPKYFFYQDLNNMFLGGLVIVHDN